jgi:uncharacterized membrane protein YeaQ/YmgE (transglycosylase-associated protein family)
LFGFIVLAIIAAIAGSLGRAIAGYSSGGCLISAAAGFIGALLGNWLSRQLGLPELWTLSVDGQPFPVIWSIIGAALFTAVLGLLGRRRLI